MEISEYKENLLAEHRKRDVDAIIRLIAKLVKDNQFPKLYSRLLKEKKITSTSLRMEEIADALIREVEQEQGVDSDEMATATYMDIAEELKKLFGEGLSDIYLSSKMPSEFMMQVRSSCDQAETERLSDDLVEQYKQEVIRVENGRRVVSDVLQRFSNFPAKNATTISKLVNQLQHILKSNYKYLSIKPHILAVRAIGNPEAADEVGTDDNLSAEEEKTLFRHYFNTGEEPAIAQQIRLRIAVNTLFRHIREQVALPEDAFRQYTMIVSRVWSYRSQASLTANARKILEELLIAVNADQMAVLKRLALTFVEEYRDAEDQMRLHYRMIQSELAVSKAYLGHIAENQKSIASENEEKIRVVQEKVIGLDGVFETSPAQEQSAAAKSFLEQERTALGISTTVGADKLTEWIKIYSILFSNSEFLAYTRELVDFSTMRNYISDLCTYHLILNIAQLKAVIDLSLNVPDEEKMNHFKLFNEALKLKLHNLISGKVEEKSLRDIIEDLDFLDNSSLQFVIAETFEGFQTLADAFNATQSDYFVNDREALMKESRDLYSQICNKCLKNFTVRPVKREVMQAREETNGKRSWLTRLFSS